MSWWHKLISNPTWSTHKMQRQILCTPTTENYRKLVGLRWPHIMHQESVPHSQKLVEEFDECSKHYSSKTHRNGVPVIVH